MPTSQQINKLKIFIRASSCQRITAAIVCLAVFGFFGLFALAGLGRNTGSGTGS